MPEKGKVKEKATDTKAKDDNRMAAQPEHDDVWATTRDTVKNAGVEERTVSDNAKIEAGNIVSDPGTAEQRAGTPLTKAEI